VLYITGRTGKLSDEDKQREERARSFLGSQAKRAIELRSKEREFHGLEHEFHYYQERMIADYERSKDIKHPRDVGDAREEILRHFLNDNGLIPNRFSVSGAKTRVASPTGHSSAELDVVLYDRDDSISLMRRDGGYQVLPIESVYGVIQVKSRLTKKAIREGLKNLASFKTLTKIQEPAHGVVSGYYNSNRSSKGFGVLFAYDSDLEWGDVVQEMQSFADANKRDLLCNAVFILKKGFFLHGDGTNACKLNPHIDQLHAIKIHGYPDRDGSCLYQFMTSLLLMLRMTEVSIPNIDRYFRLPFVAGQRSYEFSMGMFSEIANCPDHGDYRREISEDSLKKVVDWCRGAEPINWIKATDIALGRPGDNYAAYERQPLDVRIYNPRDLALKDILFAETELNGQKALQNAFDSIETEGMTIYIPMFYTVVEDIIGGCPRCGPRPKFSLD
jgi:hypothetical protein